MWTQTGERKKWTSLRSWRGERERERMTLIAVAVTFLGNPLHMLVRSDVTNHIMYAHYFYIIQVS